MLAKAGSFNSGTGILNSTQEITIGFQAKVIFFWWSGRTETTDAVGGATHRRGFGVATSTSARFCLDTRSVDAGGSAVSSSYQHNAACIMAHTDTTVDGLIDISAIGATSFTLIVDDVMPYDLRVHYLALGGSDVINAACGSVTAASGSFTVSGLAFQPNFALLFGTNLSAIPGGSATNSIFSIGANATTQFGISVGTDDGVTTMDAASFATDQILYGIIPATVGTSLTQAIDFGAFQSDGFTTSGGTTPLTAGIIGIYVALSCTNVIVGNSLTRTDGNDITVSGLGWKPAAGFVMSHCKAESSGTTLDRHDELSIGAFTSETERVAHGTRDTDALADAQVTTAVEHDEVYINMDASDAVEGLMDVKSVDSGGVTFVMDDADPVAAYFGYILFGPFESGAFTVNVSDGVSVSENRTISIADLTINVTQNISVSEDRTVIIFSGINQFDSVALIENRDVTILTDINLSDAIGLTESIGLTTGPPQTTVFDSVAVTESALEEIITNISVSEGVSVADSAQVVVNTNIDVFDNVSISESSNVATADLQINTSELISVTESANVSLEIVSDLSVNVSDLISITENTNESIVTQINVFNNITLAESVQEEIVTQINVSDGILITESASEIVSTSQIDISDNISITENIQLEITTEINKFENISVTDTASETISNSQVNVSESVTITENIGVAVLEAGTLAISVSENILITENVGLAVSSPQINITDSITILENIVVTLVGIPDLNITVSDNVNISENTLLYIELNISISDIITVIENISLEIIDTREITVVDNISITENTIVAVSTEIPIVTFGKEYLLGEVEIKVGLQGSTNLINYLLGTKTPIIELQGRIRK